MRQTERIVMLQVIDNQWKDHLLSMDELKQGIGNRAYGQKDPLVEYKKESYELFTAMMDRIEDETVRYLYFLQVSTNAGPVLPFPDEDEEEEAEPEAPRPDPNEQQRLAAKSTWRTSRATSSARRSARWSSCSSSAAMAQPGRRPWCPARRPAATIPVPAAAERSIKSATGRRWGTFIRFSGPELLKTKELLGTSHFVPTLKYIFRS
jgi:hypothetical protein